MARDVALRTRLQHQLEQALANGVAPGAVAGLARRDGAAWKRLSVGVGRLETGGAAVRVDTPYDLASLTKPFVAMTALRLAQRAELQLEEAAQQVLPELGGTLGGAATLSALLSHRAGLSPWGGLFREITAEPGSAAARAFMLREAAQRADPAPSSSPGSVYSDLGYLVAGEVVARAAGADLEEALATELTRPLGIAPQLFYAARLSPADHAPWLSRVAPTERCAWRQRLVRGEVHDENCAAYGGVAGHAGLFGDAGSVLELGIAMLDGLAGRTTLLSRAWVERALAPLPGGGHVLGWDTKSASGSSAGARMSPRAFGHLGFTGTSIWCDPDRELCVVLLTNRVYPSRDNVAIRAFRPAFHDALLEVFDAG